MTVDEMLKSVAVASANDCAVALAEHLAGTEEAFVARMNERAAQLGMENTHFQKLQRSASRRPCDHGTGHCHDVPPADGP